MKRMNAALIAAGTIGASLGATRLRQRLALSLAKHPSLTGHARMSRRVARLIPYYLTDPERFFDADGAPADIAAKRCDGFDRLRAIYASRFPKSTAKVAEMQEGLSDLQFTASYRVPFPFQAQVRDAFPSSDCYVSSHGVTLTDLDGNSFFDVAGSYGVNLLGVDTYRAMIEAGSRAVDPLGPILGGLHPLVADNAKRLREISGLDEVSFHMSGTEAVMQAVRLARYHSGRPLIVRFSGAYHGWWGDVQPGVGNPIPADRTLTLADMSERTLKVLAKRRDIACVLVNPLQAMHPNMAAPGDSALVAGRSGRAATRASYGDWLRRVQSTCNEAGIAFIVDEVFTGFRLARGGACEYFGLQPDLVTYGKTLGGGLPVGVVCGKRHLMRRFRKGRPADICFARGTFNSHPYVMGSMHAFLSFIDTDRGRAVYAGLDKRWGERAASLNARLSSEDLPLEINALSTIWSICHLAPSRYNWMLQYYLRAEGLALSWVGTGRLIFSLAYDDAAFNAVSDRFLRAARAMAGDGWWWVPAGATNAKVRRRLVLEMIGAA